MSEEGGGGVVVMNEGVVVISDGVVKSDHGCKFPCACWHELCLPVYSCPGQNVD